MPKEQTYKKKICYCMIVQLSKFIQLSNIISKGSNREIYNDFVRKIFSKMDFAVLFAPFHGFSTKSVPD